MMRRLWSSGLVLVALCSTPSMSPAADIVFDGTAADGFWTNGPQIDPNIAFPENAGQGANWTIDAGPAGQIVTPDAEPGGARIDYTFVGHDWTISGATINENVQVKLEGGSLDITNSTVSLLPTSANTGSSLSGLNLGQNGVATTAVFTNSTVNVGRANNGGRALGLIGGSTLGLVGTALTLTSESGGGLLTLDNGSSITLDATSSVDASGQIELRGAANTLSMTIGSTVETSYLRADSGGEGTLDLMVDFAGGSFTVNDANPFRDNSGFEGQFNFTGVAGSGTVTHTDLSNNNNNLAGKIAQGFFSIDDMRISPTTSHTLDWTQQSSIDALNAELSALVVNSKFFEVTTNGSQQVLSLVASTVIDWLPDADENWNDPNNWSSGSVPGVSDDVLFAAETITAPRTVDVDTPVVINKLTVDGSNQYTFDDLSGGTLDVNEYSVGGGTHEIAAPLAGGNTTVSGGGTLILSANNTGFGGNINIASGTLQINDPNNLGSGSVTVDGTLRFEDGYDAAYSKNLVGSGQVTVNLAETSDPNEIETLDLTGNNSAYAGSFSVQEGVLKVDSANDLGNASGITNASGSTGVVELDGSGGNLTLGESFDLGGRAGNNFAGAELLAHLRNASGDNTITGNITTSNSNFSNIETAAGTSLTINNTIGTPAIVSKNGGTLRFQGDGDVTIGNSGTPGSGQIIGSGNILKQGSGTLTIATGSSDPNDYSTGTLTIESGTVEVLTGGGDDGELFSDVIDVQTGSTFDIDSFGIYNIQRVSDPDGDVSTGDEVGQTIRGGGTIVAQTLQGFDHLRIAPGDSVGTLNVQGNFTMLTGLANPTGRLSYELGNTTAVGGSENDLIDVTGNLTLSATNAGTDKLVVNVLPVEGVLAAGSYRLINYGGSLLGNMSGSNFDVNIVDNDDPNDATSYGTVRQTFAVSTGTSNQVNLVVTGSAQTKNWVGNDGSNPTFWDIDTSDNWSTGGGDNRYINLDQVVFGDGASSFDVVIQEDVRPGTVTFNNSAGNDYTIGGADPNSTGTPEFGIAGLTSLVKNNTGTATLTSTNSFQGGIQVNGGTLILNGRNAAVRGDISVAAGAILQLGVGSGANEDRFPNGEPAIAVDGELVQNEGASENIPTPISGTGVVRVESGTLNLRGIGSTYSGGSVINGGTLAVDQGGDAGTGTITVNSGGQFRADGETHTVSNNFALNGGSIAVGGGGVSAFTLDGNVTVSGTGSQIRSDGGTGGDGLTMAGSISGAADLEVRADSNATVNFTGALATTGTVTKTSSGTMALSGGTGTISSPIIDVAAGNLSVVNAAGGGLGLNGQVLSGEATVTGNVTTAASSIVRVGDQGMTGVERLIGHWTFDTDGSDSSTNNNPASFGSAAQVDPNNSVAGGGSLALTDNTQNNGGNRATVDGFAGVTGNGGRTYSFWLNAPDPNTLSQNNSATFIGAGSNSTNERFDIKLSGGDELRVEVAGGGVDYPSTDGGAFFDGTWHHVAVTLADGGTLDDVKLYLDGVLLTDDGNSGGTLINTANNDLFFGDSHNSGNDREFQGNLDDIQHYDIELDSTQVAFLFNNPGSTVAGLPQIFEAVDFEITGDLTLDASSTLEIDLANTSAFDTLIVGGALSAAGTLDVNLSGGFSPSNGDSFDILDFDPNSVSGVFGSLDLPALTGGLSWDTSALLTTGVISVIGGGLPGDFNSDGRVNGADFLLWQRNPSVGSLSDWENNYGLPTTSNTSSVPEPSALVLLSLGAIGFVARRRRS